MSHDGVRRYNYVDGHLNGSDIVTWTGTSSWPTSDTVIGSNINNNVYVFNGIIDDVTVYSGAITQ
jgi:hypothetical protein